MATGDRFVAVNSANFEAFLQSKGFERSIQGKEVVYIKKHERRPNLQVKVYTSLPALLNGSENDTCRDVGRDAIRVVAIFDNGTKSFAIGKFPRVYRTGSEALVFERTLERMRAAYQRINEWLKTNSGS